MLTTYGPTGSDDTALRMRNNDDSFDVGIAHSITDEPVSKPHVRCDEQKVALEDTFYEVEPKTKGAVEDSSNLAVEERLEAVCYELCATASCSNTIHTTVRPFLCSVPTRTKPRSRCLRESLHLHRTSSSADPASSRTF